MATVIISKAALKQNFRSLSLHATISEVVRVPAILTCVGLLCGCGDTSARQHVATADEAVTAPHAEHPVLAASEDPAAAMSTPAAPQEAPAALDASIGSLDRPSALKHFFEALARLDAGQSHDDVPIVQFGDSHTAADFETGPLRRALQARFGDGGRGFVAIGNPWKKYVQEGLRNGCTSDWLQERGKYSRGQIAGDGMYGLCGAALRTTHAGARAWADYTARSSRIELAYLEQPRGGSLDVLIDGARAGRISTSAKAAASAFHPFEVSDGPHRVEIATVGDGEVRIFGTILDRAQVGVTLDALGINGARAVNALAWSESHMVEQMRHRAPDLVVLAYGTNEAGDDTPDDVYERQLVELLGRIARAVPTASCMLVGPPDRARYTRDFGWATMPKLIDIIATQRRVAQAAGCAFYDQLEAMGGPGAIAAWAEEPNPRAGKDHVHLTRDGYAQLGNAIAGDLIHAYSAWRAETGLPPVAQGH